MQLIEAVPPASYHAFFFTTFGHYGESYSLCVYEIRHKENTEFFVLDRSKNTSFTFTINLNEESKLLWDEYKCLENTSLNSIIINTIRDFYSYR